MAFTPNGLLSYLTSGDLLEVYDLATHKIVTLIDVFGGNSTDVAVTPNGRHVYVTQRPGEGSGARLIVIDTTTQKRFDPPIKVPGADGLRSPRPGRPHTCRTVTHAPCTSSRFDRERHLATSSLVVSGLS